MLAGGGNDMTYWAWITVPPRRSAAFAALRGKTLVSIYVVVPESQAEDAMMNQANQMADSIFKKLPEKFTSGTGPSAPPVQQQPTITPPTPAPLPSPTFPVILPAPVLVSPADGSVFNKYPRKTTFTWQPVPKASKYIFEMMACSNGNPSDCFAWPVDKPQSVTTSTSITSNFVGAQPGKWRVTAVDARGVAGTPSQWWTFKYTR
jgi:hypothetical protein